MTKCLGAELGQGDRGSQEEVASLFGAASPWCSGKEHPLCAVSMGFFAFFSRVWVIKDAFNRMVKPLAQYGWITGCFRELLM